MTTQSLTVARLRKLESAPRLPALATLLVIMAVQVTKWSLRHRTRHQLRDLPNYMLEDIGVSRAEARQEADKRFWQQ